MYHFHHRIPILLLALGLASCQPHGPERPCFSTFDPAPTTRTLLTAPDIESRKTQVTLAAYADGTLAASAFFTDQLESMPLDLKPETSYTVYALVNMGDLTARLPRSESGLPDLVYEIPSYAAMNAAGIPAAGQVSYPGEGTRIPVERLLAKVTANLSCSWTGGVIQSVKVCNLNRLLRPFGTGAASDAGDILSEQEFQAGTGTASGTFIFYVPENRQGTLSGIASSSEKSPDRNGTVAARKDRLTYLETVAAGTGLYSGTVTYRSYLGGNAVTDFDLRRNAHYRWTIRFLPEGLEEQDWKHENALTDTRYLYWKDHAGQREIHYWLPAGETGTRAGDAWHPEDMVWGDATGDYRIQNTLIPAPEVVNYLGWTLDTERLGFDHATPQTFWFTVGTGGLPVGDYRLRIFFPDREDLTLTAWLHVRNPGDLDLHGEWDEGDEEELN